MIRAVLCVALIGCVEPTVELADYPCPPMVSQPPTYESFGRQFLASYCDGCHSAEDGLRHGAPDAYRFDTLDDVRLHRDRIFARAATTNTTMPPGPDDPPANERETLAIWLACGAN